MKPNYLTDFRDRYAGSPKRLIKNVVIIGISVMLIIWLASLLGLMEPPTFKTVLGFLFTTSIIILIANVIRWLWPGDNGAGNS